MNDRNCVDCGRPCQDERPHCFRCRVSGVSFTFAGGGGYGRKNFHDRTTAEFERDIHRDAKSNGIQIDRA